MSKREIAMHLRKFGYKIIPIGILTTLSFLFIVFNFIVFGLRFIIGFWLILAIIFQVFIYLAFLFVLGNIKKAADALNNSDLFEFHSKIIRVSILRIIGYIILFNGIIFLRVRGQWQWIQARLALFAYFILLMIGASILLLIAAIFEIMAWNSLISVKFLNIEGNHARVGAALCMIGAIFDATIVLKIISDIFRIIGYFLLTSLRNLTEDHIPDAPSHSYHPIQPTYAPLATQMRFCPNCGTRLGGTGRFCTSCGFEL